MKRWCDHKYGLLLTVLIIPGFVCADDSPIPGYPRYVEAYDAREVAMLPAYCKHTQLFRQKVAGGNDPEAIRRWHASLGDTFHHLHHYCWGLMRTNRALYLARSRQTRLDYLEITIGDFDYVIERAPKDFPLLPEILTKKGENLIRLGKGPAGTLELQKAIELKHDYWPPYAALSDYYENRGDIAKARDILKNALSSVPDAKPLQRRLVALQRRTSEPLSSPLKVE